MSAFLKLKSAERHTISAGVVINSAEEFLKSAEVLIIPA
jgi:hypothetical protein